MKRALTFFGAALLVVGVIWILQGTNILPGSFMTGQIKWAYNGAASAIIGVIILALANWRKAK